MDAPIVFHEIQNLVIQEMSGTPRIGIEIWVKKATEEDPGPQLRIAFPYEQAIDFATQLANHAERLQGQNFSP